MEGQRISREQQEPCQQFGKPGKVRGTLQVRGVLAVDRRPRRSRLCTLLGLLISMMCTTLADYSLLQRADLTTRNLAVEQHLGTKTHW